MDYGQDTLFGKKVISSLNYDEQELIRDILFLHANGREIDVDCCYSVGNFYKDGLPQPKYKFDLFPQVEGVVKASSDDLPLSDCSQAVVIFDPPFIMGGQDNEDVKQGSNIIMRRFKSFQSFKELKEMYSTSLKEFKRILIDGGIVIFKCQDVVSGGKNHFTHCWVMYEAMRYGFYPKDMFVLCAKNRLTDERKQQHARKFHCYYWVFKKKKCPVNYSINN